MKPKDAHLFVANDHPRPSWRKRICGSFMLALGATVLIFECIAAFRYIF